MEALAEAQERYAQARARREKFLMEAQRNFQVRACFMSSLGVCVYGGGGWGQGKACVACSLSVSLSLGLGLIHRVGTHTDTNDDTQKMAERHEAELDVLVSEEKEVADLLEARAAEVKQVRKEKRRKARWLAG